VDDKLDLGKVGEGGYSYTVHGQEPIDHDDTSNDYNHLGSRCAPPVYGDSVVQVRNESNQSMKEREHDVQCPIRFKILNYFNIAYEVLFRTQLDGG
jgi:hypothetical protein